jgi:T5SS/PEP-CTERM-associated repeat protein
MKTNSYRLGLIGGLLILATALPGSVQGQTTNNWITLGAGKWEIGSNWSLGVPNVTQAFVRIFSSLGAPVSIDAATVASNALNSCMTVSNLTMSASGFGFSTLSVTNAGPATPLRIRNTFSITGFFSFLNVSNSVVQFDGLSGGIASVDGVVTLYPSGAITGAAPVRIGNIGGGYFDNRGGTWRATGGVRVGNLAGSLGTLTISGGTNTVSSLTAGFSAGATGAVSVTGGIFTNTGNTTVGLSGVGSMTISNGISVANGLFVGSAAGSQGTLTIAAGTNVVLGGFISPFIIGDDAGSTGTLWLTGGQLDSRNGSPIVGFNGTGRMTVSNGTWLTSRADVGFDVGSKGTLTIAGGTNLVLSTSPRFLVGVGSGVTGAAWMTGGFLSVSNVTDSFVLVGGSSGAGAMTQSNGTFLSRNIWISYASGSGTLTVAGGTNTVYSSLIVGSNDCVSLGRLNVSGGALYVTNAADNSVLNVGGGTVTLTGGLLQADRLVMTTTCAHVIFNGGMLTTKSTVVTNGDVFEVGGVSNSATLTLLGATHSFGNGMVVGSFSGSTGTVWLSATQLVVTNPTTIGNLGVGEVTVSNGLWLGHEVRVANVTGPRSTLTLAGGTNVFSGELIAGHFPNSTGAIWKTDGMLVTTNQGTRIGSLGRGQMTVSNGLWLASSALVGGSTGGCGTLTFAGGTNRLGSLHAGFAANSTGQVWQTGGSLIVTNVGVFVGSFGIGQMTVSNGTWLANSVAVAANAGAQGTLTFVGGTNNVNTLMRIGVPCTATGTVIVAGGELRVTNASANASLEVNSGTLTISGGLVEINTLILTNSCAHFVHTGGMLIYGTAVLDPNRDDDGDGIPNGYEQDHGLDPLNAADANLDSDGDGQSNLQEFLAGTDATNSLSSFRITAITKEANDIRVTWMTGPGKTNVLERTASVAGSFTNDFTGLTNIVTTGTVTNYLDMGAATNTPSLYYRVRLVP